jgi:hypothetical protein
MALATRKFSETWQVEAPIKAVTGTYTVGVKTLEGDPNHYLAILDSKGREVLDVVGKCLCDATDVYAAGMDTEFVRQRISARFGDETIAGAFSGKMDSAGSRFLEHGIVWEALSYSESSALLSKFTAERRKRENPELPKRL